MGWPKTQLDRGMEEWTMPLDEQVKTAREHIVSGEVQYGRQAEKDEWVSFLDPLVGRCCRWC